MTETLGFRVHDDTGAQSLCTVTAALLLRASNPAVIQRERSDRKIPRLVAEEGMTTLFQNLLSFSRSARESPGWFHQGNDSVLPGPCVGDPRFARMTEERATLARPRATVRCPSMGDSTACGL